MMLFFPSFLRYVLPIAVAIGLTSYWLQNKRYAFEESELIRVTQKHIGSQTFGQDHRTAFDAIVQELRKRHERVGVRQLGEGGFPWMWTRVGGMGKMGVVVVID